MPCNDQGSDELTLLVKLLQKTLKLFRLFLYQVLTVIKNEEEAFATILSLIKVLFLIKPVLAVGIILPKLQVEEVDEELNDVSLIIAVSFKFPLLILVKVEELEGPLEQLLVKPLNLLNLLQIQVYGTTLKELTLADVMHHVANNVSLAKACKAPEANHLLVKL